MNQIRMAVRVVRNDEAVGSIPTSSTKFSNLTFNLLSAKAVAAIVVRL
jgi:hypothetical protein